MTKPFLCVRPENFHNVQKVLRKVIFRFLCFDPFSEETIKALFQYKRLAQTVATYHAIYLILIDH